MAPLIALMWPVALLSALAARGGAALELPAHEGALGVRVARPVYTRISEAADGRRNLTLVLTVWLRRIGGTGAGPFTLPHQQQAAIRMFVWVDDPTDLHVRKYGHLWMPNGVTHEAWQPQLMLETEHADTPPLVAVVESRPEQLIKVPETPLRPYSLRVDLPPATQSSECFKLIDASYPKHKHIVCLPPTDGVCSALAPADRYTDKSPALWTAIGPIRHINSTRMWQQHYNDTAIRLGHFLSWHLKVGAAGLLLYADELSRNFLNRFSSVTDHIKRGTLRFVHWDMPERWHDEDDGRGRVLGYNYDQALFASHAMLGLSGCGVNLALLITDIDEHLYPMGGKPWPEPFLTCVAQPPQPSGSSVAARAATYTILRYNVQSSKVPTTEQYLLWGAPTDGSMAAHPMNKYDLIARVHLTLEHQKRILFPSNWIVLFFVHDAAAIHGVDRIAVDKDCFIILHILDALKPRWATWAVNANHFRPWEPMWVLNSTA